MGAKLVFPRPTDRVTAYTLDFRSVLAGAFCLASGFETGWELGNERAMSRSNKCGKGEAKYTNTLEERNTFIRFLI